MSGQISEKERVVGASAPEGGVSPSSPPPMKEGFVNKKVFKGVPSKHLKEFISLYKFIRQHRPVTVENGKIQIYWSDEPYFPVAIIGFDRELNLFEVKILEPLTESYRTFYTQSDVEIIDLLRWLNIVKTQ